MRLSGIDIIYATLHRKLVEKSHLPTLVGLPSVWFKPSLINSLTQFLLPFPWQRALCFILPWLWLGYCWDLPADNLWAKQSRNHDGGKHHKTLGQLDISLVHGKAILSINLDMSRALM